MRRLLSPPVVALAGCIVVLAAVLIINARGEDRDERNRQDAQAALVDTQRAGCERSKLDRADNARGWRTAEAARRATATNSQVPAAERDAAAAAAREYAEIAASLERRSRIDCDQAFPRPAASPALD